MAWRTDGLHKRGKVWYIGYRDENGKAQERTTRTTDYTAAKKFRADFMERLRQGQLPTEMADWKLQFAVDKYNEWRQATAAPKTAYVEKTLLRAVVAFFGSDKRLRSFKAQDFRDYQVHRSQCISPTMKRPVQPRSINYELLCLRTILKRANLWHGAIAQEYRRLRQPKPTCGRALSPDDGERLMAVAGQEDRWQVAFCCSLIAYLAACRSWEIKTLRIGAVDLDRRCLVVREQYAKTRQRREVELNSDALWAVRILLDRAHKIGAVDPDHFLLPHYLSGHTKSQDRLYGIRGFDPTRHQTSWSSAWRSLRERAGLPTFRFHDLRHTFTTQSIESGTPVDVVMAQVGHLDPAMVRHYTRAKREAVESVQRVNKGLSKLLRDGRMPKGGE